MNSTRAGLGAVEGGAAAPHTLFVVQDIDANLSSFVPGVKDEAVRKILRDTDGLGTDATRAGIIELLFKRGFLQRQGKQIRATDTGTALIQALPLQASLPDMTARWEAELSRICQRETSYQAFMQPLQTELGQLISQAATVTPAGLPQGKTKRWGRKKATKPANAKASGYRRAKQSVTKA